MAAPRWIEDFRKNTPSKRKMYSFYEVIDFLHISGGSSFGSPCLVQIYKFSGQTCSPKMVSMVTYLSNDNLWSLKIFGSTSFFTLPLPLSQANSGFSAKAVSTHKLSLSSVDKAVARIGAAALSLSKKCMCICIYTCIYIYTCIVAYTYNMYVTIYIYIYIHIYFYKYMCRSIRIQYTHKMLLLVHIWPVYLLFRTLAIQP